MTMLCVGSVTISEERFASSAEAGEGQLGRNAACIIFFVVAKEANYMHGKERTGCAEDLSLKRRSANIYISRFTSLCVPRQRMDRAEVKSK